MLAGFDVDSPRAMKNAAIALLALARTRLLVFVALSTTLAAGLAGSSRPVADARQSGSDAPASRLSLQTRVDEQSGIRFSEGTFAVPENRASGKGRLLRLGVVVLRAKSKTPKPDPVFVFAGGPGSDITRSARAYSSSSMLNERDIVLVSQRGTGGDNRLACGLAVNDENIQGYLDPLFREDVFRPCLEDLRARFDLTQYSTETAADDYDDVRQALGYDRINVTGGSYGTRMALVYMRRHPTTVRTALLNGAVPLGNKNPLYHPASFDLAIRALMAECAGDAECKAAVPNLEAEFHAILGRLDAQPAATLVTHPTRGVKVPVKLSREAFLEALRVTMYSGERNRLVPSLLHRAYEGDFAPFAELGLVSERNLRNGLALGHLLCVTCAEDVDRITEQEILSIARPALAGDHRVRDQKRICSFWPRSVLSKDYGNPVAVEVPTLVLSGTLDPVTPPRWGEEAARHLPRALHVVVPGAHGVGGPCVVDIQQRFRDAGTVEHLDVSCTKQMKPARFQVTAGR